MHSRSGIECSRRKTNLKYFLAGFESKLGNDESLNTFVMYSTIIYIYIYTYMYIYILCNSIIFNTLIYNIIIILI